MLKKSGIRDKLLKVFVSVLKRDEAVWNRHMKNLQKSLYSKFLIYFTYLTIKCLPQDVNDPEFDIRIPNSN